jgi:hypothetical protein
MYIACFCHETLHFKLNIFGGKAVQRGATLKTAVFDQPSDQFSSFDNQATPNFFSTNPNTFGKKKFSGPIFHFLTNKKQTKA